MLHILQIVVVAIVGKAVIMGVANQKSVLHMRNLLFWLLMQY